MTEGVDVSRGKLALVLVGINKDIYSLPYDTLYFSLIAADNLAPSITVVDFKNILKNTASLILAASEPVMVYYMLALVKKT